MLPEFDPVELAQWSVGMWFPCEPSCIRGVSNDTRTLKPDNLYFAIRGDSFDGHSFVSNAFKSDACGAVVDDAAMKTEDASQPLLVVKDTRAALLKIAAGYRKKINPAFVVGITGSVGKSTVKEMIASMVGRSMSVAKTKGNWNNDIGLPLSILSMDASAQVGIFEVGMNHPGEIAGLCKVLQPTHGVITPIGPVHTEFFDGVDKIAVEKATLLESLSDSGVAVLNLDEPYFNILKSSAKGRVVTVSSGNSSADYIYRREAGSAEMLVKDTISGEQVSIPNSLPGNYNVLNAALAVAVSRTLGIEWDAIAEGMNSYRPMPMRWEESEIDGVIVVNDAYNANPLSMRASITAFQERFKNRNQWLILAGMLELGKSKHDEHIQLGEFVAGMGCAGLIAVGELGMTIANGAEAAGMRESSVFKCDDNSEAAKVLKVQVKSGDAVLLKGSRSMALENVLG